MSAAPRVAVIVFPGTWSDRDFLHVAGMLGWQARAVWHAEAELGGVDAVVLTGGFAHGDYLRTGAIARFTPVMAAVGAFAGAGGPVIGSCNGFQILCEAGMLPGALMRNAGLHFVCRSVGLKVENSQSIFTSAYQAGEDISIPVAHHDGNYQADAATLDRLEGEGRVAFRYTGDVNGSARSIAGILNGQGNVLGMMPHPERALETAHGNTDGRRLFEGLLEAVA